MKQMQNLDDIKKNWKGLSQQEATIKLDNAAWQRLLGQKVKKQKNTSMQYFWASLTFQIIVYGCLTNISIRFWKDPSIILPCVLCLLLYVPFTIMLMKKFKQLAIKKWAGKSGQDLTLKAYVVEQYSLISSFYKFKKKYELVLIPFSSAIFVWVFFKLYSPNSPLDYPFISLTLFTFIIAVCVIAIISENKRNFKIPLKQLESILKDIDTGPQ